MKIFLPVLSSFLFIVSMLRSTDLPAQESPADQVNLFMGVRGNSNGVIGPQLPHGSVNPSPQTPNGKHGGYIEGQPIRGFGQLHVSGTGWGRYGQILLSPQTGSFTSAEDGHDSPKSAEIATPYYYSVFLDRYNVKTELAPTHHCAVYRFGFPGKKPQSILLDVAHNIPRDIAPEVKGKFLGGAISFDRGKNVIKGWGEYAGGFGSSLPYKVFFSIRLQNQLADVRITNNGSQSLFAEIILPENASTVQLQVGISLKSVASANDYIRKEIGNSSLEEIKATAKKTWDQTLSAIAVKGGSEKEQQQFYTALYHSFVMPRDRTGDNPHWNSSEPHIDDHYCVWDTWRTKYPLMILLRESFVANTINSFIDRFTHNGVCNPTFTSSLDWDQKQGGDDVDNIIADAIVKGVKGFDRKKAYELMLWNADHARHPDYLRYGWLPETGGKMSCSYEMEYAYNDFCASQVAKEMNDLQNADRLGKRSQNWEKLFDTASESKGFKGFITPRRSSLEWLHIDPAKHYGSWVEYFYEGNSWVYSLFTPHAFDRLIEVCGGKEQMIRRLRYGFDNRLIDLSNEPGFLTPFIFSHCERPDLTAKYVRALRSKSFSLEKGYPDNEDGGAMGSWYVFTSIGLFPNAGQDFYYLLPPAFDHVSMRMENGRLITIESVRSAPSDAVIDTVLLNGKSLSGTVIHHKDLVNGASIVIKLKSAAE
ncbi:GH92 family glycosyl hydrolase [Terrimonas sp. NA20]|uniref:GH92 family glycosyl hydrolase n=1 Tax=Terrimonas ginsenosidimutans TaxID=2908004 RepID=A0ABS9KT11_9BACT|nr:GH92 family glycosyl hydrolase [Terrimonas ginsenosidimutans]MCG2615473.1 GH92 family glycosyl hydrolase [Terrimonas ginsenosidimutans]